MRKTRRLERIWIDKSVRPKLEQHILLKNSAKYYQTKHQAGREKQLEYVIDATGRHLWRTAGLFPKIRRKKVTRSARATGRESIKARFMEELETLLRRDVDMHTVFAPQRMLP